MSRWRETGTTPGGKQVLILADAVMSSALPVLRKGSRLGKHLPNCQCMVTSV